MYEASLKIQSKPKNIPLSFSAKNVWTCKTNIRSVMHYDI